MLGCIIKYYKSNKNKLINFFMDYSIFYMDFLPTSGIINTGGDMSWTILF